MTPKFQTFIQDAANLISVQLKTRILWLKIRNNDEQRRSLPVRDFVASNNKVQLAPIGVLERNTNKIQ